MENENFDGDESGQEIGDDENEQKLSTALDHIKKCEICNTNICIKFKQLVKMLTKHQLVQFLEKKLREDQKEIVEAERRRKAPHSPYSQIAKSLLLSKRKVHTNFSSDLLSPPPQRIPPTSPQFVQSMPSQNVQNPSGIILELDAFLRDYGLNRPNADDFANTRVDDVMRMLREPPYEASLSIQDRLNNFRFAFINSELFHGFDRGEIENEITRLIGEHSRANAIPPAENNDNSEPILVQQQQQPPMPQRAKRR
uniref:Bromo domain-containing protein n=1 Tax=Panagrolaimus sp. PS1159 TaxID=55785 RepID=A0AC35GXU4_9BILA